jgi:4-aminobutyrate aminotransferase/(S)-3-amino-2-methylpropionate transaminase
MPQLRAHTDARSQQLLFRRDRAVPRGIASATPIYAARARNAEVWDVDGRRYIDFAGGIGALATGHCHPSVIAAVAEQLGAFTHTAFQVMAYPQYVELAERLSAKAPITPPSQAILFSTGSEAVENAVKVARIATRRTDLIAFTGAFHGRSMLTMALTGKFSPYKKGYGRIDAGVHRVPFPVPHCGISFADTQRAIENLFYSDVDPSQVAAVVIEPVQGEGGFHVAPAELMRELRALCDAHGIVLIADEVQSGVGRTGRFFAMEHYDVEPDLLCVAKSLAGGFPLSAVIGRESLFRAVEPGGLGGTYGGSPVGCAAALAVLDVVEQEGLVERATSLGFRIRQRFEAWSLREDLAAVRNVRGLGAMLAFDLPDAHIARRVTSRALELGLIVLTCGRGADAIRMLLPLTIEDEVLAEGLDLLECSLKEAVQA